MPVYEKSKEELLDELTRSKKLISNLEAKLEDFSNTKEELEKLIESSPVAIIVIDFDGRVRRWSPAAERIFGWTEKEVIGKVNPIVPSEYAEILPTEFDQLREGKDLIYNPLQEPFEVYSVRKNGSEVYMSLSVAPIYDTSGKPEAVINMMTDLTERKEFEAKLKESENKYKAIFENTGTATIIFNKKGIITMQNSEMMNMSGYAPEEVEGKMTWMEFIPPKELKMMREYHQKRQIDPTSVPKKYESRFITKDGIIKNIQITVENIPESGEYVSSINDITDLRDAEKELKKSLEEKNLLIKEIHHRVKNNLMIISSLLELQSSYIEDEEALNVFKDSENRANAMAMIHERLYKSTDLKNIDFGDYIRNLTRDLYISMVTDPERIKLEIDVEDMKIDINTVVPLGLIVNELVTNSMKYAFPDDRSGQIKVELYRENEKITLKVSDNGIGFPEDMDYKNTSSLGLQLVNNLTTQIKGELELERSHGTTFTLIFEEEKGK